MKLLIMQSPPFPSYLVPLGPHTFLRKSPLKHLQPVFLPHCVRPRFTLTYNRQIYVYIF